ncbi:hypothetical protein HG531_007237 [Fusarium graminearum]|nr:hypothetical protein HG531_007237 [Fusarium graminearum]
MAEQSLGRGAEKDLWEESLFNIWSDLSIDYVQKVGCAAEGSQGGLPIRTRRYTVDTVGSRGCQIPIATLVKHACFVGIADCYKDNSCVRINKRILIHRCTPPHVDDPRVLGQLLETLSVENVARGIGSGEDHNQCIGLGEKLVEIVLGVDLNTVANTLLTSDTSDLGAETDELRGEALCDVAETPDEHARITKRCESILGSIWLRTTEVTWPFALELVITHLVEATSGVNAENVVGARSEGLDPLKLCEALCGVLEVIGRVCPGNEDLGVDVLFWDGLLDVV